MYSWFLKRKQQGKLWVEVKDVNKTNALLKKEGISYSNIKDFTAEEITAILGVDAVINGRFETNKPMSGGVGAALGILVGFYGATNRANINMFIHNADDGKILVKLTIGLSGYNPLLKSVLLNVKLGVLVGNENLTSFSGDTDERIFVGAHSFQGVIITPQTKLPIVIKAGVYEEALNSKLYNFNIGFKIGGVCTFEWLKIQKDIFIF